MTSHTFELIPLDMTRKSRQGKHFLCTRCGIFLWPDGILRNTLPHLRDEHADCDVTLARGIMEVFKQAEEMLAFSKTQMDTDDPANKETWRKIARFSMNVIQALKPQVDGIARKRAATSHED
jgi:hypothetical protein